MSNPFIKWLLSEGWNITDSDVLVDRLALCLAESGLPLYRMRVLIRTLHPQVFATHYTWRRDTGKVGVYSPSHDMQKEPAYLQSPIAAVFEGAGIIRRRLDIDAPQLDFPYLTELLAEGSTDYVVMPMVFQDGKINAVTLASDVPGGFDDHDLELVAEMLPVFAHLMELHASRQTARTLLDTYIGRQAGKRILDGLVKRGDGEKIHSVIWFCDLRDSVRLAETLSMDGFLDILNDFFDAMAGAVLDHGGEVLRFIGDAALAIFPFDAEATMFGDVCHSAESACARSLAAAREARTRINAINEKRRERKEEPLRYGLALHVGDVMYVNIGIPQRLEFTVIGKAANEAARLEELCKVLDYPILISSDFPRCNSRQMTPIGLHCLRGSTEAKELYTLSEETDPACDKCYKKDPLSKRPITTGFGLKGSLQTGPNLYSGHK